MSMRAILQATRDHLAAPTPAGILPTGTVPTGLGIDNDMDMQVMPDGMPPPMACTTFIAVWGSGWNNAAYESLDENYTVNVTVSVRTTQCPPDHWGLVIAEQTTGLYARAEAVRATLHRNYDVVQRADAIIKLACEAVAPGSWLTQVANGGGTSFEEPLFFKSATGIERKGGSWWWSSNKEQHAGLAITLSFGTRRTQAVENQF